MTARPVSLSLLLALAVSLSVLAGSLAAGAGVAGANHGAEDADFTVEPMDDRSPGATNVKYGQIVVGKAGVDLETLESMKAVFEEGSFANCGPGDSEVFGIDRGNTKDGYGIDEELQDNTKSFSAGEDVFRVEFYGENDFGPSTHLNDGDAVVSVAKCFDNPDEPGWYQISGSTTGVTEDGERVTVSGASHYFWICDCENEREARQKLGPPPSEDGGSGTPATPAGDGSGNGSADGSGTDGSGDATPTAGASTDGGSTAEDASTGGTAGGSGTTEPTGTTEATDGADSSGSSRAAATGDGGGSWDSHLVRTPTPGSGDGFGGTVAVVAFLAAAMLFYRRR